MVYRYKIITAVQLHEVIFNKKISIIKTGLSRKQLGEKWRG